MARRPGACAMERLGLKAAVAAVAQAGGVPGKTGAGREGIGRICRNGRREAGVYRDARPAGAGREGIGRICRNGRREAGVYRDARPAGAGRVGGMY